MSKRPSENSTENDAKKQKTNEEYQDEMKKWYEIQELENKIAEKENKIAEKEKRLLSNNDGKAGSINDRIRNEIQGIRNEIKGIHTAIRHIRYEIEEDDEDEEEQKKDMGRSEMMEIIYKKNMYVDGIPNTEQQQTDNNNNNSLRKKGGSGGVTNDSKIQIDRTRELLHVNPKDLSKQDVHGNTIFHYLAKYSQRIDFYNNGIIKLFNQYETLLNMFNKHGQTPLDVYEAINYGKVRDRHVTKLFEKGQRFLYIFKIRLQNFQTNQTKQTKQHMQDITRSCTLDQWLSPCALCRYGSSYLDYIIILYKQGLCRLRYIINYFLINQCVQINDSFRDIPWIGTPNALKEILKHIILMQVIYDIENNTDHYKHIANVFFTFYKKKITPCLDDGIEFYNSLIQQGIYLNYR